MMPSPADMDALAPTGTLRVAANTSNIVLVQVDAAGALSGVVPTLAHELARRLGCSLTLMPFKRPRDVAEAATTGTWDVCFLADEPARAVDIAFTRPYVVIEGTYMVPDSSFLTHPAQLDAPGLRIGVSGGSGYDLFLTRTVRQATIVRSDGPGVAYGLLERGEVDAVAGVRQALDATAQRHDNLRVMAGRFMTIPQAGGVPRTRPQGHAVLEAFLKDALRTGLVANALRESGQDPALAASPTGD